MTGFPLRCRCASSSAARHARPPRPGQRSALRDLPTVAADVGQPQTTAAENLATASPLATRTDTSPPSGSPANSSPRVYTARVVGHAKRCGPQLAFNPITGDSPARGRTHFDVFVPADQARARVDAALAAGGRLADDSHDPAWWSLASPDNHGVDIASWTDTYD